MVSTCLASPISESFGLKRCHLCHAGAYSALLPGRTVFKTGAEPTNLLFSCVTCTPAAPVTPALGSNGQSCCATYMYMALLQRYHPWSHHMNGPDYLNRKETEKRHARVTFSVHVWSVVTLCSNRTGNNRTGNNRSHAAATAQSPERAGKRAFLRYEALHHLPPTSRAWREVPPNAVDLLLPCHVAHARTATGPVHAAPRHLPSTAPAPEPSCALP